jgi:hypothetical protein
MTRIYQPPGRIGHRGSSPGVKRPGRVDTTYPLLAKGLMSTPPLCLQDMLGETFTITRIYDCNLKWYYEAWFMLQYTNTSSAPFVVNSDLVITGDFRWFTISSVLDTKDIVNHYKHVS